MLLGNDKGTVGVSHFGNDGLGTRKNGWVTIRDAEGKLISNEAKVYGMSEVHSIWNIGKGEFLQSQVTTFCD